MLSVIALILIDVNSAIKIQTLTDLLKEKKNKNQLSVISRNFLANIWKLSNKEWKSNYQANWSHKQAGF